VAKQQNPTRRPVQDLLAAVALTTGISCTRGQTVVVITLIAMGIKHMSSEMNAVANQWFKLYTKVYTVSSKRNKLKNRYKIKINIINLL
jgi:hypothetical protein